MNRGAINRIIPFSSVDGPGNRTAIFLQGCNFNCLYCHNPETINHCTHCGSCIKTCPADALQHSNGKVHWNLDNCSHCHECLKTCSLDSSPRVRLMTVEEIIEELNKLKFFISGITVSGGECTLQIPFLVELFKEVKKLNLSIFVDTNGSIPLWEEREFLSLVDQFMVDLKSIEPEEHKRLTGMDCDTVLKNIKHLAIRDQLYEIRTVVVPKVLDNERNVADTSKLIATLNPEIRYKLIKYRPLGVRKDLINTTSPTDEDMKMLEEIAKENGCHKVVII